MTEHACCKDKKSEGIIKVKKLHKDAQMPTQAKPNDIAYDLIAIDDGILVYDEQDLEMCLFREYRTGLAIQPPNGYHTEICPRSSISKYNLMLANGIGQIDEPYRGELLVRFKLIRQPLFEMINIHIDIDEEILKLKNTPISESAELTKPISTMVDVTEEYKVYKKGDAIAQLKIHQTIHMDFIEVEELTKTVRGSGGFGSTDKK